MTPLGYRRLILTRHAKSAWDDPAQPDEARPLNARGRRAARELGDWLASRGYDPEEVLCSTATRTRQTWELAAQAAFETRPLLRFEPSLYHATPEAMRNVLRSAEAQTVMMVGHNPGIAEFAASLPAHPPLDPDFRRYPTAATLVVDFQIDNWSQIEPGTGSVLDFTRFDGRR
ncbi:MAG: histidine phosphatase family protein [Paracoccus sp. (in: a-proteobacteria)]|uniref:SixA phosphatase family protein n=1 Tax=Paracoccus sp. TaxID=267 RepID=UPI0026DEF089|nr:histidine phosphatase family protein [Paracoccus sp. (in: a-proteobacteria)]MDO5620727.1 histidine phosphatase family protein [Paracoccus sp. (in: a-proteobacteria)]